jgi:hypothetical protein
MAMKYIVTWRPAGELDFLTIIDGVVELTVDQIMEIVFMVEDISNQENYEICSIIRADNVDVIC